MKRQSRQTRHLHCDARYLGYSSCMAATAHPNAPFSLDPDAETGFTAAQLQEPVKRGAYLVTIGHCMECHSTWEKGISDYENGLGRGGRPFGPKLVQGFPASWDGSTASNITSHRTKGIGAWTDAEIKRAIADGVSRDGRKL